MLRRDKSSLTGVACPGRLRAAIFAVEAECFRLAPEEMIDAMQSWGQLSIPVRLVAAQAVVGSLLALIWGIGGGAHSGLAALTGAAIAVAGNGCLLYTSPSPRDLSTSRMPSSA